MEHLTHQVAGAIRPEGGGLAGGGGPFAQNQIGSPFQLAFSRIAVVAHALVIGQGFIGLALTVQLLRVLIAGLIVDFRQIGVTACEVIHGEPLQGGDHRGIVLLLHGITSGLRNVAKVGFVAGLALFSGVAVIAQGLEGRTRGGQVARVAQLLGLGVQTGVVALLCLLAVLNGRVHLCRRRVITRRLQFGAMIQLDGDQLGLGAVAVGQFRQHLRRALGISRRL